MVLSSGRLDFGSFSTVLDWPRDRASSTSICILVFLHFFLFHPLLYVCANFSVVRDIQVRVRLAIINKFFSAFDRGLQASSQNCVGGAPGGRSDARLIIGVVALRAANSVGEAQVTSPRHATSHRIVTPCVHYCRVAAQRCATPFRS